MADINSIPSHSPSVVSRKTGNEYVLVPVTGNIADMDSVYTLNETGAFIWDLIDGKRNVNEISMAVQVEFEVDEKTALKDVQELIDDLKKFLIIRQ
jgi:hypothetical protein